MPSQLYANENVSFVCGRNFVYNGKEYTTGDDFPQDDLVTNPETMVRTRFLIPVVDDLSDKPRHWHREIKERKDVLKRLGKYEDEDFDPSEHTVEEVKEFVGEDTELAQEVLEEEEEGKDRVTLVEHLEEVSDSFNPGEHTVEEVMEYLTGDIDEEELQRVLDSERNGKARKGILGDDNE